jgi:pimeloyl-ACP methyl ester carboxylesterase
MARDFEWSGRESGEQNMTSLEVPYGTAVGETYANLIPKVVRAMVLDGNVDADGYLGSARSVGTSERTNNDTATGQTFNGRVSLPARYGRKPWYINKTLRHLRRLKMSKDISPNVRPVFFASVARSGALDLLKWHALAQTRARLF